MKCFDRKPKVEDLKSEGATLRNSRTGAGTPVRSGSSKFHWNGFTMVTESMVWPGFKSSEYKTVHLAFSAAAMISESQ
jgi:hypothetical protein